MRPVRCHLETLARGTSGRVHADLVTSGPAAAACGELLAGALADNPRWVGKPLREPFVGHWVARRGEYRIRYRIDETTHTVFVVAIRHRRDAYRAYGLAFGL